ncbi:hypothetical protein CYLTODRAFT_452411 [Cylindrobasidium torrendii FP15055 ss-10]|uniref:C2H2-type domain-containing protein n=1 Tax=Cylindrobasidium torrendii FP15055 ss-10 TaxID=1314674 RepID=A0A0D7BGH6_9AGAR|nr:hypothetical protein CYLTODRAFT_452411 [Cylindrobasidium torrendii FP15055 ss-10]
MSRGVSRKVAAAANANPVTCQICTKVSSSKRGLKRHMDVHNESTRYRFQCKVLGCGYSSRQRTNLDEHHATIHLGLRDLGCPYCSYHTGRAANINQHQKRNHPERPVVRLSVLRAASKLSSSHTGTSTHTSSAANRLRITVSPAKQTVKFELPTRPYLPPNRSALELDPATGMVCPDAGFNQFFDEWFKSEWQPALEFDPVWDPVIGMVLPDEAEFNQTFDEWFNSEWDYGSCYY